MLRAGNPERAGWIKAPPAVEGEIRTVWLEDEMPEELKDSPGYVPFVLGPEAQAWVDGMSEVVDGGKAVFGRPRPQTAITHRSLASQPPLQSLQPPQSSPPQSVPRVPPPLQTPRPVRPAEMPEIGGPPASRPVETGRARTLPKRVLLPEIGENAASSAMPEIGGKSAAPPPTETVGNSTPASLPEIGESRSRPPLPEVGRKDPSPPLPEIGEDGGDAPRLPEIGE